LINSKFVCFTLLLTSNFDEGDAVDTPIYVRSFLDQTLDIGDI